MRPPSTLRPTAARTHLQESTHFDSDFPPAAVEGDVGLGFPGRAPDVPKEPRSALVSVSNSERRWMLWAAAELL